MTKVQVTLIFSTVFSTFGNSADPFPSLSPSLYNRIISSQENKNDRPRVRKKKLATHKVY